MQRVGTSQVWSWSTDLPSSTRTTYLLAPNDSRVPLSRERNFRRRYSHWRLDPFNPKHFVTPKDPEVKGDWESRWSVLELPRAPRDPLTQPRPAVPKGTVTQFRLKSRVLRNSRRAWFYEPPPATPAMRPPGLVLAFDGKVHTEGIPVPTLMDNLQARGELGRTWMLSLDSLGEEQRQQELACHPPFVEFLVREVLPWLERRLPERISPARTFLAGQSLGGLAAVHGVLLHPERFAGALSQSGAFGWTPGKRGEAPEWLAREVASARIPPRRFFLEAGRMETTRFLPDQPTLLESNRHMRDVLMARGHEVRYQEFEGGHDYVCWRESFSTGLRALLATAPRKEASAGRA